MRLIRLFSILTLLAQMNAFAVVQTQDPHSTCAILYGFEPGSEAYNNCVAQVEEQNAQARNGSSIKKTNNAQAVRRKTCCGK